MRTVTNIFIVNLAVADFFVILLCLPPTVVWDVTETWFLGELACKVVIYFQVIVIFFSNNPGGLLPLSMLSVLINTVNVCLRSRKSQPAAQWELPKKKRKRNVTENYEAGDFNKTDVSDFGKARLNKRLKAMGKRRQPKPTLFK